MSLTLYRRGKIWHYRGTAAGRRLRGSTGTADKATAQRVTSEAETRAWNRHLDGPGAHVTMAQAAIAYREAQKPTRFLDKIEDHWKDTPLRDVTTGAVRQSALTLYPHAQGATRNRQVIVPTQAIINHAASLGWCSPIKVPRFPIVPKTKAPVSEERVIKFAAHASAHLGALCYFMFGTASRIGEAVRLTWGEVDLSCASAKLYGDKPKPWTRQAHLPPAVIAALANIPSNRDPDELVFQLAGRGSVTKAWVNAAKRAGIAPLTPHSCRHGFATMMMRERYDVVTIAKAGGWKDPATVLKYYGHALDDKTVTNVLFDTPVTQASPKETVTNSKRRKK